MPEALAKAGDTIAALLAHPDPVERALALTLAHVEPKHISIAEKDPHPRVQAAVARWRLKHLPPERVDGFTVTHGQVNDRNGPSRIMYFHASPEHSQAMGVHGHGVTQYSRKLFQHFGHYAPDIMGYVRYTGDPAAGKVQVHEVRAPWHLSPGMRGVHVASWLNNTFGTDHDLGQIEGEGQSLCSDLAHHGVEHRVFGGKEPEGVLHDSFTRYVQTKGAKEVHYAPRPYEHPEDLRKDIGFVTFPNMGVERVPTKPLVVQPGSTAHATKINARAGAGMIMKPPKARVQEALGREAQGGAGWLSNEQDVDRATPPERRYMRGYVVPGGPREVHGIENHEAQHSVFAALGQRYGGQFRWYAAKLLMSKLTADEKNSLDSMMQVSGYDTYQHPEEGITCHQNYLTDPKWREHVHSTLGLDSIRSRQMHNTLKVTWKKLRSHAALLTPAEIIGQIPTPPAPISLARAPR